MHLGMSRYRVVKAGSRMVLAAGAIIALTPAPVMASFMSQAAADNAFVGFDVEQSSGPLFDGSADFENSFGGHAYASTKLDFRNGLFRGRAHGCVQPPANNGDQARGSSSISIVDERMVVRSDTLPAGTLVSLSLCISFTANLAGMIEEPLYVRKGLSYASVVVDLQEASNGASFNRFAASLESRQNWTSYVGTGSLNGVTTSSATITETRVLQVLVGQRIDLNLRTEAAADADVTLRPDGVFPLSDGTAGYALNLGVESITQGVYLEWAANPGVAWTGSCGDSSLEVPPNPVPGAGTAALAGMVIVAGGRRRRAARRPLP